MCHDAELLPPFAMTWNGGCAAACAAMAALTAGDPAFQPRFERADTSVSAAVCLDGQYGPRERTGALPSSPPAYVRPEAPPFFVAHGDNDTSYWCSGSRRSSGGCAACR